jgi:DNA-binding transcriptional ArsR family regulator
MVELNAATPVTPPPPPFDPDRLDAVFHALADSTRRSMLRRLADGPHSIGELAAPHAMTFAAVSKHLRVMERAGLVRREVQGRRHVCRLEPVAMQQAEEWIARQRAIWEGRFDRLDAYLLALHAREQAEAGRVSADPAMDDPIRDTASETKKEKE